MKQKPVSSEQIAEYYNRNTLRFLRLGGSGETVAAIHRQVWAPGVKTARQAFETLNHLVAEAISPTLQTSEARLLDLGCGIGGTATWVAERLQTKVVGVTLSAEQARLATQRAACMGLGERCQFIEGDFQDLPDLGLFQAAWAIEAYIHAQAPQRFFQQASKSLLPGGRLVIADDFLSHASPPSQRAAGWLQAFQSGWRLPNLATVETALGHAEKAGFRLLENHDLSPCLRAIPAWAIWISFAFLKLPFPSVFWESLRGSTALQECVRCGWTSYHLLVWEKIS